MTQTKAQRRAAGRIRTEVWLDEEDALGLEILQRSWKCSRSQALRRAVLEAQEKLASMP